MKKLVLLALALVPMMAFASVNPTSGKYTGKFNSPTAADLNGKTGTITVTTTGNTSVGNGI